MIPLLVDYPNMIPCACFCCVLRPESLLPGMEGNGDYRVCQRKLANLQVQGASGMFICGCGVAEINDSKSSRDLPRNSFLIEERRGGCLL